MKKGYYLLLTKSIGAVLNSISWLFPARATQLAYALFSEPREGKLVIDQLPKILQEAKLETLTVANHHFQTYTWAGNETKILLIHGWESNASRWEKLLPYLQKSGSTIIAIDAPAHGLSSGKEFSIPQYAQFIHTAVQQYNPNHLVGHSLGGKTCLYYQHLYQNKTIEKIVILGSPSDFRIILNNYVALLGLNTTLAKALATYYLDNFNLDLDQFSAQLFAATIPTSGFIAHDTKDTVVRFTEGEKIAKAWENAVFYPTKNLGHSMHDDALYQKITQFLVGTL